MWKQVRMGRLSGGPLNPAERIPLAESAIELEQVSAPPIH